MIRERSWYPILYMFCVTGFFSSIVIGLTAFTSDRVEANERLAFEQAVLSVIPGVEPKELSRLELHQRFVDLMEEPDEESAGAYVAQRDGRMVGYALPISGQGFWAPIRGMIGIEPDGQTITGIAFYEQNETPGLGAEITTPAFKGQFEGKEIAGSGPPFDIRRPGTALDDSAVHGVTGATQTSDRLEIIINDALRQWRDKNIQGN